MSPLTTEGVEELHTVIFAKKKEYSGVIFEGDAQTIVNVVNSLQPYLLALLWLTFVDK
jgi:hypothetical protein